MIEMHENLIMTGSVGVTVLTGKIEEGNPFINQSFKDEKRYQ